jgi:prepilin-type N-terminal cleavage/methylation domain-containing protein
MKTAFIVSRGSAGRALSSTVAKAMVDRPKVPQRVGTTRPASASTRNEADAHRAPLHLSSILRSLPFAPAPRHSLGVGGFTLLELLAVIAVIGILTALLIPGIRSAQIAAGKARTRVQFNQWAAALESFRGEYGYYPALHSSNLVNPAGQTADPATLHLFHDILAARRRDSSALPAYASSTDSQFPEVQNRKLISFHAFAESDFTPANLLRDAFDNTEIAVLVDRNLDGIINATDYGGTLPVVGGISPTTVDFPAGGVRAGVIFYAPAPGASAGNPGFIFSWK